MWIGSSPYVATVHGLALADRRRRQSTAPYVQCVAGRHLAPSVASQSSDASVGEIAVKRKLGGCSAHYAIYFGGVKKV